MRFAATKPANQKPNRTTNDGSGVLTDPVLEYLDIGCPVVL